MCAFYLYTLDYLESPLAVDHAAVVFALYYLYFTQPDIWRSIRIRVNAVTWAKLCQFYTTSIEQERHSEAALMFERLRQKEAFDFVVEERVDYALVQEREEFKDARELLRKLHQLHRERIRHGDTDVFLEVEHYQDLLQAYRDAKKRAQSTPQMTKLAQDAFEEKFHFKETNMDRLAKYAKDIGFMEDTVLSVQKPRKRRIEERVEAIVARNEKKKREWNEHYGLQSD
ncbi:hypothetical protein BY458DRAFT_509768 [Sporodiniella umbellata]|nr:hypothetical protein BY458DRAFT_509768 [Sporodiniella umbellata]